MLKNVYTTAVTLLLVLLLSAMSTGANAQGMRTKHVAKHGTRAHLKARSRARGADVSHVVKRKGVSVSITLSRTKRDIPTNEYLTSGYMTGMFIKQKGHLPWPVDSRKIMTRFGFQPYEANPSVSINNLGINIAIDQDSCVRVVYDGIVDDVMDIGDAKAVMVLHGKYFTIYSDLGSAVVVKGQQVVAGDVLGQVGETGQVDFRIYDPYDVWQDPQKWLARGKN